jgi:hypothetical protein
MQHLWELRALDVAKESLTLCKTLITGECQEERAYIKQRWVY